jgi:beta-lactamase regulating signal transducer with metallopeptidase domain/Mg-chelatase subunit ChlD
MFPAALAGFIGQAPGAWGDWLTFGESAARYLFTNWALHSTGLLALGLVLSRTPRGAAAARHGLLFGALILAALAPLTAALPQAPPVAPPGRGLSVRTRAGFQNGRSGSLPSSAQIARRGTRTVRRGPVPDAASAAAQNVPRTAFARQAVWSDAPALRHPALVLLLAWALVVLWRLAALAHGMAVVARWRRRAVPVERQYLGEACVELADVPVLEAAEVRVPSVVGIRRPCVLLPAGLAARLDTATLRHVLLHEEAHVRRRDPLWLFLAELAHAALFWNPLAALVRRELELSGEDACDARVLARGITPTGYARTLLSVLEHAGLGVSRAAACPLGTRRGDLARRVKRILSGTPRGSRVLTGAAAALLAGAASAAGTYHVGLRPDPPTRRKAPARLVRARRPARPLAARRVTARPRPRAAERPAAAPVVQVRTVPSPLTRPADASPSPEVAFLPASATPATTLAAARAGQPREGHCVVFLLDVSTSMRVYQPAVRRQIMELARALGPGDRFDVIAFAARTWSFASTPVAPGEESLEELRAWIDGLPDEGGTNLERGLARALDTPDVTTVILFSDGQPSQGITGLTALVSFVERRNRAHARVLAVSPGPANKSEGEAVLASLAEHNNGEIRVISNLSETDTGGEQ